MKWESIKQKYNYTCLKCGRKEPEIRLTRDHVIPRFIGGTDKATNIQPLCDECNHDKGATYADYRENYLKEETAAEYWMIMSGEKKVKGKKGERINAVKRVRRKNTKTYKFKVFPSDFPKPKKPPVTYQKCAAYKEAERMANERFRDY